MLVLFRLIDVIGGSITLGGLDTAAVGLDALRRQLAIIPQVCVVGGGTPPPPHVSFGGSHSSQEKAGNATNDLVTCTGG